MYIICVMFQYLKRLGFIESFSGGFLNAWTPGRDKLWSRYRAGGVGIEQVDQVVLVRVGRNYSFFDLANRPTDTAAGQDIPSRRGVLIPDLASLCLAFENVRRIIAGSPFVKSFEPNLLVIIEFVPVIDLHFVLQG